MALTTAAYLIDKSAYTRLGKPPVGQRLRPLIARGDVATCGTAILEVLYSARSSDDYDDLADVLLGLPRAPIDDGVIDIALAAQAELARMAQHRGASLPDLILAAAAKAAGLAVLHYDSDFDRIAAVTGQPTEWVVPRGSVD